VVLVTEDGNRWLVAPYGLVDWVKNARKAGKVNLLRGNQSEDLVIRELPSEQAAPILKEYLKEFPLTKSYFDSDLDSPIEDFIEEANSRPVFELIPNQVKNS
jgi:hypothetical protein